ncbi:MAG: hypothetical protein CL823_05560 [Crocinitomicaceae bacterium]|nr:hypothetical protein [Crocinitomicaceae bacterium]|tara:strand:+ start:2359 stop:3258 length:900 start_codon:yes stop_codon:yes gene_type:complete
MKQFLLPCALLFCGSLFAQTPLLEENFDSYDNGSYIGESSSVWTTWSGTTGTDEDGIVSDEQANSGTQSLKIFGSVTGGPMDVYLPIGLEDAYEVSFQIYVPSGYSAYMNIQEALAVQVGWAFDMYFNSNGSISLSIDQVEIASMAYSQDTWNQVTMLMDPVNDRAEVYINGEYLQNFAFEAIIGGLNLFGYGDGTTEGLYYIDDVVVVECDDVLNSIHETELDLVFGPNPASNHITISSNTQKGVVRIMALNGSIVERINLTNLEAGSRIDLDLENGIYLVELIANDNSTMRKLVINR